MIKKSVLFSSYFQGYNSHVKRNITLRERMPFAQFSAKVLEMAHEYSLEYKTETRCINNEPSVPRELWAKAAVWAKDKNIATIKRSENESEMFFFAPSTKWLDSGKTFDADEVVKIQEMAWKTFDQYAEFGHNIFYSVRISKDKEKWHLDSQCTCPDWHKNYMCKHTVGIALRRKIAILPANAIPTLLSQNRKPGRPAKSTKALLVQ